MTRLLFARLSSTWCWFHIPHPAPILKWLGRLRVGVSCLTAAAAACAGCALLHALRTHTWHKPASSCCACAPRAPRPGPPEHAHVGRCMSMLHMNTQQTCTMICASPSARWGASCSQIFSKISGTSRCHTRRVREINGLLRIPSGTKLHNRKVAHSTLL